MKITVYEIKKMAMVKKFNEAGKTGTMNETKTAPSQRMWGGIGEGNSNVGRGTLKNNCIAKKREQDDRTNVWDELVGGGLGGDKKGKGV